MINRPSYAELHCHSAFSFLDGASLPEDLAATAQSLGYSALALTDHNGLYGSMTFAQAAKPLGLQAITGAEVTLVDGAHLTLLAETPQGYANLCRLLTETRRRVCSPSVARMCSGRTGSSSSCSAIACEAI